MIATSEIERISPLPHQHIHTYGHYGFDLTARPTGYRTLRTLTTMAQTPATAPNRV